MSRKIFIWKEHNWWTLTADDDNEDDGNDDVDDDVDDYNDADDDDGNDDHRWLSS